MDLIPNFEKKDVSKNEVETVEKKKHEYKLLGSFSRTKGLKLFSYNTENGKLRQLDIENVSSVRLSKEDLKVKKQSNSKTTIHNAHEIAFEALNMKNAKRRLSRWIEGRIPHLFNLKRPV